MTDSSPNSSSGNRPTICKRCGSIVGGGETQCAVCGAETATAGPARKARPVADGETIRFARAVLNRPQKFTIVLLVANLFVYLLMWQSSGLTSTSLWSFPDNVLLAYGAKLNSLINEQHQWWRFITPMFVHVNLPHVLVNMYSLWMVGPYVEKLYGSARFVVFWVLTGIAGVMASYLTVRPGAAVGPIGRFLFKADDVPSAGASGALFGLVGVLFIFGIKFRHELPEGFKRAFGTGMLPIIFINLFIGYLGRGFIDNAAHLGGLISGSVLALAVNYRRPGERMTVARIWQILQIACIGLVAVSFFMAYRRPVPAALLQDRTPFDQEQTDKFVAYVKAVQAGQEALYLALKNHDTGELGKALKELEAAPHLDAKSDQLREELKSLIQEAETLGGGTTGKPISDAVSEKQRALATRLLAWSKEYNLWLKAEGKNFGGLVDVTGTPGN